MTHPAPTGESFPEPAGHIPALDGLRGIAVLLVLLRHASATFTPDGMLSRPVHELMRAGWAGVDIFFALSGFLITGILLDTKGEPRCLRNFYARRALRIFPLYFTFLFLFFIVGSWTPLSQFGGYPATRGNQAWFWTYTVNLLIPFKGERAAWLHTSHLWSLSVEEQFYVVWPWVVMFTPTRFLKRICLTLSACAVSLRLGLILKTGWGNDWAYMLMPSRMDALLLGGWLAAAMRIPGDRALVRRAAPLVGSLGVVTIAGIFAVRGVSRNDPYVQLVGYTALAGASVALIALTLLANDRAWYRRLFETAELRTIGKVSYAFYVVQYPIIFFLERYASPARLPWLANWTGVAEWLLVAEAALITFAVSWLSWRILEQPMLSLKRFFPRDERALPGSQAS